MPRMARLVVSGYPHHVTQCSSRRQTTFFGNSDYNTYIDLLASHRVHAGVEIWAYCPMPNHVHLILLPRETDSLARRLRDTHSTYARQVNAAQGWCGHLWQDRINLSANLKGSLVARLRGIGPAPGRGVEVTVPVFPGMNTSS